MVDAGMGGDDDGEVAALEHVVERLGAQVELAQLGHVGVVVVQVGAEAVQQLHDLQRRRLAHVADAGLVGDADHRDPRAAHGLAVLVERALDALDAVVGHGLVDLAGQLDELRAHVELAGAPGQVERVHGQAVTAHPRARLEAHEPVGLGRRRLDDLPDVDAHAVGEDRQLVDERDVDRAEDVLQQLGHLRHLGGGDADDVVGDHAVQRLRAIAARGGEAADDLRGVAQRVVRPAGVDALGREGEVEIAPRGQARLLQQRQQALARRAGVGRRLEHDELAGLQHPRQGAAGVQQRAEVGLAVGGQRGRHADEHRLGVGELGRARGRMDALQARLQALGRDVLDVGAPVTQRLDLARVDVEADDVPARLGERDGERQTDVAESDDADAHARERRGAVGAPG